ncbi:hypothetical protein [Tritonibacter horizontis]|uniref:Uncharacterized protein n=1 Tax=Tritonibacter horizontis TaxID=1768241 RepID=A0A132BVH8_9RHOB|nr:hypothetical protein [Tritonibacter horizontis]KUP92062.1 hypothetical protein TRIHO_30810 [Tritonibacter horizontis]
MTSPNGADEILTIIEASPARRMMGVAMLVGLGGLTLYLAMTSAPGFIWQLFLLAVSGGAIWIGYRMWQATSLRLELTSEALRCSDGEVLVRIADLEALDRGAFAFKPSNGFLMRSTVAGPRRWYPGLWWRMGRRIGVGGVTAGSQTKTASEIMSALMLQRDAG